MPTVDLATMSPLTPPGAALAEVREYSELIEAMRARAVELQFSNDTIDELSGVQRGYTGKCLGPAQVKRLGPVSFGAILGALGLKLRVEVDEPATQKALARGLQSTKSRRVLASASAPPEIMQRGPLGREVVRRALQTHLKQFVHDGARARADKLTPRRRSQISRKAARTRWARLTPEARRSVMAEVRRGRKKARGGSCHV